MDVEDRQTTAGDLSGCRVGRRTVVVLLGKVFRRKRGTGGPVSNTAKTLSVCAVHYTGRRGVLTTHMVSVLPILLPPWVFHAVTVVGGGHGFLVLCNFLHLLLFVEGTFFQRIAFML